VLSTFPDVQEVNVYGVKVGNMEGRAGMACMIPAERSTFDVDNFYRFVMEQLPAYAAPLFLRLRTEGEIVVTGTFKHVKTGLVTDGFNPDLVGQDKLYFRDDNKGAYIPLDKNLYDRLASNTYSAKL